MKKPKLSAVYIEKATGKAVKPGTWKRSVARGGKKYARYFASKSAVKKAEKQSRQTARELSRVEKRIQKIGKQIKAEGIRRKKLSEESKKTRKAIGQKIKRLRSTRREEIARRAAAKRRARIVNKILKAIKKEKEQVPEAQEFIVAFTYRDSGRSFDVIAQGFDDEDAENTAKDFLRHDSNAKHIAQSSFHHWDVDVIEGRRSPARARKAEYRAESSE